MNSDNTSRRECASPSSGRHPGEGSSRTRDVSWQQKPGSMLGMVTKSVLKWVKYPMATTRMDARGVVKTNIFAATYFCAVPLERRVSAWLQG